MTETNEPHSDSATSKANAMALAAEAEAAEAEALAAAARARARAAQLKREALEIAEANGEEFDPDQDDAEYEYEYEYVDYDDYVAGDQDAETTETEDEETGKPFSWRNRYWIWLATKVAAILVICCFAGLSAYFVWQHHDATQRQQRAAAFTEGAKKGVINMIALDYRKAKEDVQRVIDSSTGEFRDEFAARANDFTKVVEQSKVVTEGTVNAIGVESMDGHTALVLVSATSRVTEGGDGKQEPREWRLRVTVTEEDGQYKMSKVDFVP